MVDFGPMGSIVENRIESPHALDQVFGRSGRTSSANHGANRGIAWSRFDPVVIGSVVGSVVVGSVVDGIAWSRFDGSQCDQVRAVVDGFSVGFSVGFTARATTVSSSIVTGLAA